MSKGPEVYIDRIEITGNTKTRDKVIRRELELEEQQRFSGSKLRRSQERLRRLGFFEDVNITTRKAENEDRLDLLVDVKEGIDRRLLGRRRHLARASRSCSTCACRRSTSSGAASALVLNADFGSIRRNFSLDFTEPYFLDTQLTAGISLFNWQLIFDEFTRGGTGAASARSIRSPPWAGRSSAASRWTIPASGSSTASRTPRSPTSAATRADGHPHRAGHAA